MTNPPPHPEQGPYASLNPYGGDRLRQPHQSPPPGDPAQGPGPAPDHGPEYGPGPAQGPGPVPGPRRGRAAGLLAALVAVLLVAGGVSWYALGGDDEDGARRAGGAGNGAPAGGRSASPSAPAGAAGDTGPDTAAAERINASRAPGDARLDWTRKNDIDVPGLGADQFGPWTTGDTVATALYRTVAGYSVADGRRKWSLVLDREICRATPQASADGRIVVVTREGTGSSGECRVLRMIDLRTGKQGWQQTVAKEGQWDIFAELSTVITGNTVTAGRAGYSTAYRLGDGTRLFGRGPGPCHPFAFAGGPKLIAAASCDDGTADKPHEQIQELDPETGKARWTHEVKRGYHVDHVYSVQPLVVSLYNRAENKRGLLALTDKGVRRAALVGPDQYAPGCSDRSSSTNDLQTCRTAADAGTFAMATVPTPGLKGTNQIVVFSLDTGRVLRRIPAPAGRTMFPLRMAGGELLAEVHPTFQGGSGMLASVAPGATTPKTLLRLPPGSAEPHRGMDSPRAVYEDGRYTIVAGSIGGSSDAEEKKRETIMSFSADETTEVPTP
ncbi:PQQ-binding-like beta-propeller repeat protein [Streptomyces sp. NPDC093595]|uniref:outer membrane protein assembly factor BamB family protein n=1 Tax=Streptomyces sp. NPDC093595 TaxID=3366045 RepID=UPI0038053057